MSRGFLSGALWGTLVAVVGLGSLSLLMPLPTPESAGDSQGQQISSESRQVAQESVAVEPAAPEAAPATEAVAEAPASAASDAAKTAAELDNEAIAKATVVPDVVAQHTPAAPVTVPQSAPDQAAAAPSSEALAAKDAAAIYAAEIEPKVTAPKAEPESAEERAMVQTQAELSNFNDAVLEGDDEGSMVTPQLGAAPDALVVETAEAEAPMTAVAGSAAISPDGVVTMPSEAAPSAAAPAERPQAAMPEPVAAPVEPAAVSVVEAAPQPEPELVPEIVPPVATPAAPVTPPPAVAVDPAPEAALPLWQRFASKFSNPAQKPLFSVLLVDGGGPDVDREALAALPFPVTFALDATASDTAMAAALYREAGHEVVLLSNALLETHGLSAEIAAVQAPQAEAIQALGQLWPSKAKALSERAALQGMIEALKAQGQALVLWESEEALAAQMAQREQIAHALIFRRLDGSDETISVMRRYLDRAAFKAVKEGGVLVAGDAGRAQTLAALLEWSVEGRAATVALAPLSALLSANFPK